MNIEHDKDRSHSRAIWNWAQSFYEAYKCVSKDDPHSRVGYYLICHSIELVLKAYMRGSGFEMRQLKGLGHDLTKALEAAEKHGLDKLILLTDPQREALDQANNYYAKKEFEYIKTGGKHLPELDYLASITNDLLCKTKSFCIRNENFHHDKPSAVG